MTSVDRTTVLRVLLMEHMVAQAGAGIDVAVEPQILALDMSFCLCTVSQKSPPSAWAHTVGTAAGSQACLHSHHQGSCLLNTGCKDALLQAYCLCSERINLFLIFY